MRRLVLGGARSGKSTWAEAQFADRDAVEYVATSWPNPDDPEWVHRVQLHRERRPATWRTTETIDLVEVLGRDDPAPVLVDCLALWLDRVLADAGAWDERDGWRDRVRDRFDGLVTVLRQTQRDVILVSNEVGSGVVPASSSGRLYRDELGRLNALVAAECDEVWVSIAGIARQWK